ncbi:glycosyltransferase [Nocardiopsis sp. RSe5-2]|uniref:Glycosyltransferase n=1 Tax=Nocardiopsis endophytica TaxID=3018445 RepID=A0ABT4U017_9ACTN|nr:glycosyltransferase [Nocardiopsis endophytica]MDA2810294.1 glycosyltransferase [Nocardiopsis endophytica]
MKIAFLIVDRDHIGGVVSAVHNMAGALAARHEVEVVALRRARTASTFPLDGRVRVVNLTDVRPESPTGDAEDPLSARPPKVYPGEPGDPGRVPPKVSRLTELRLLRYLAETDADAVVSSNPKITVVLGRAEGGGFLRLAQEHSHPWAYAPGLKREVYAAYRSMDAVTVLTPETAERTRADAGGGHFMPVVPNCVPPAGGGGLSASGAPLVVTGGVLKPHKGFDVLVEAFAQVSGEFGEWGLRIHGGGPDRRRIRDAIERHGVYERAHLMGPTERLPWELAKGAVFALPSKREPFGNVLVEAMSLGLPVVSADCDHGPRNIITSGKEGLLVPPGDAGAMADALRVLLGDPRVRAEMGEAARSGAERFGEGPSAERFTGVLEEAARRRAARSVRGRMTVEAGSGDVRIDLEGVPEGAEVVLHRRTAAAGAGEAAVFPVEGGTARVPRQMGPAEGEWTVAVRRPDGVEAVVADGGCDTAGYLAAPRLSREAPGLRALLPYVADDGAPSVRSRVRTVHAEVRSVRTDGDRITLHGDLWGTDPGPGARVEAVRRESRACEVSAPAEPTGGGGFRAALSARAFASRHGSGEAVWDLWLVPGEGAERTGLCRLDTDVLRTTPVFTHPEAVVPGPRRPGARLGPLGLLKRRRYAVRVYFSSADRLAVKVVPAE